MSQKYVTQKSTNVVNEPEIYAPMT